MRKGEKERKATVRLIKPLKSLASKSIFKDLNFWDSQKFLFVLQGRVAKAEIGHGIWNWDQLRVEKFIV